MTDRTSGNRLFPGEHPHSDRPNWRPAETVDEYFQNCREGLETYSDIRLARLLGVTRTKLWRMRDMALIPQSLFDRLLAGGVRSTKQMAQVGQAFRKGNSLSAERCPHCGCVLRLRTRVSDEALKIIGTWLVEQEGAP